MKLYAFGSNSSGQLGVGHREDTSTPQLCRITTGEPEEPPDLPRKIVAGGNTTLILFESGLIYRAGVNYSRAPEPSHKARHTIPEFHEEALTIECKAKLCSATWDASIIVTRKDEIYVCGRGPKGELGLGSEFDAADDDMRIDHFPPKGTSIVDVASSVSHTIVVLSGGQVYGWGNGRKGQLGEPAEVLWAPRRVEGLNFKVERAACGREFTFLMGDSKEGQRAILGSDKWGVRSQAPTHIQCWKDIGASWGSIFILGRDGKMCSWGRNDWSQLASGNLSQIESMAIGSEHAVTLTADGIILCWGWGEHGNCGAGADSDGIGNTIGSWNEIKRSPADGRAGALGVGAGCATSFYWTDEHAFFRIGD
ncbi:MAG: hypothetical protein Q9217_002289 [Psora testacea]